ncbi:MAG: protocatechuate dioxygenase [Actinomycetota bacterium]
MTEITRRTFIAAAGVSALAVACSDDSDEGAGADPATTTPSTADSTTSTAPTTSGANDAPVSFTAADFAALGTCVLFPEATAGPFPTIEQIYRRDVTEGYAGHPVRLGMRAIDGDCNPIPGADVEIWHTDATGDYSSYEDGGTGKDEGAGTTFLRGAQIANDDGIVEFATNYPGWYPGRAVHIHLRVRVDGDLVLTGQVYFDDDYTAQVFAEGAYAEFGLPDTPLSRDFGSDDAANGALLALTPTDAGTTALINIGVPV